MIHNLEGKSLRGVIFDLDGTLVDSAPISAEILDEMRTSCGMRPLGVDKYRPLISHGADALVRLACNVEGDAESFVNLFRHKHASVKLEDKDLFLGVKECLSTLKLRGFKLGVCSNKPGRLCSDVLMDTGLIEYFDVVVAGGDMGEFKPSPAPLLFAVKEIGLEPQEVIFVGDSSVDQETALRANIRFAFFSGGYDDGVDPSNEILLFDHFNYLSEAIIEKGEFDE